MELPVLLQLVPELPVLQDLVLEIQVDPGDLVHRVQPPVEQVVLGEWEVYLGMVDLAALVAVSLMVVHIPKPVDLVVPVVLVDYMVMVDQVDQVEMLQPMEHQHLVHLEVLVDMEGMEDLVVQQDLMVTHIDQDLADLADPVDMVDMEEMVVLLEVRHILLSLVHHHTQPLEVGVEEMVDMVVELEMVEQEELCGLAAPAELVDLVEVEDLVEIIQFQIYHLHLDPMCSQVQEDLQPYHIVQDLFGVTLDKTEVLVDLVAVVEDPVQLE
jgi:hypothetical protein